MAITGIFVQYIKYVKAKNHGSTYAMHFFLRNDGKSTQDLAKAKKFSSKEEAIKWAKKYYKNKKWYVFQQTEFNSKSIAKKE